MIEGGKIESRFDSFSVLVVIVIYKMRPRESVSFKTLQRSITNLSQEHAHIQILLYDNSPEALDPKDLPETVLFETSRENRGVAGAYSYALALARSKGFTWLLALDQDTNLAPDFMEQMGTIALRLHDDKQVGAIVPQLVQGNRSLSPLCIRPWGVDYLPTGFTGFAKRETHAYNSGSLFRISALDQIGGFNRYFWLDYLDAYVYKQLYLYGKKIYVAGDVQVEHDLSLLSSENGPTVDRFNNFLLAECAFCDLYGSTIGGIALSVRLFGRTLRQYKHGQNSAIRHLTRNALKRRILETKAQRIKNWQNEMERRMHLLPDEKEGSNLFGERLGISVCMAAYNGERYITAQLQSILSQLAVQDEIIVVDDASTDGTKGCVRALQDSRIRLVEHTENLGVLLSFEDAIRNATKSIIFLSDQDDLWVPDKVTTILQQFQGNPSVTLVASDASLIDQDGNSISESYFVNRGTFRAGLFANLIRNRYGGCTLAFRASLLSEILPLPHRWDVLHDIWIGVRNSLSGHQTLYISKPLVLNRRHATTATGKSRLGVARRIRIRFHLLLALIEFWMHANGAAEHSPAKDSK